MQPFPLSCVARDGAQVASPHLQTFIFTVRLLTFCCKYNFLLNNCLTIMIIYRVFLDKCKKASGNHSLGQNKKKQVVKVYLFKTYGLIAKNMIFSFCVFEFYGLWGWGQVLHPSHLGNSLNNNFCDSFVSYIQFTKKKYFQPYRKANWLAPQTLLFKSISFAALLLKNLKKASIKLDLKIVPFILWIPSYEWCFYAQNWAIN